MLNDMRRAMGSVMPTRVQQLGLLILLTVLVVYVFVRVLQ
jgi:hypothetical protein